MKQLIHKKTIEGPAKQQEKKVGRMGRTPCPGSIYLCRRDDIPLAGLWGGEVDLK